jgi:DNA-binding CsgD family transcriptional regulator
MPEVIGRRRELADAAAHLRRAAVDGTARLLVVEGVAGIGKSTALRQLATTLATDGFRTVSVALSAAETSLSWAGLRSLCSQFDAAAHAALPPAQRAALAAALGGEAGEDVEPMLLAVAFTSLVAADVAAHGPLLLIVDDTHWLDQATASAIAATVRASAAAPVAAVFASRPERRPLEPERLLAADRVQHLGLQGLSLIELQELLADRFGVVHRRPDLIRLHEVCGGNVMHAIEIGRMLADGHSLDDALLPPTLQAMIDGELARLPTAMATVLEPMALLPRPRLTVIERAVPGAEAALAQAEDAGLINVRGDQVSFAHPLLRAGLLDRIGGLRRRRWERTLAELVDDPEERVMLRAAAATAPDEELAAELESVGEQAMARGATHVAAQHFDRSVELTSQDDPGRARRLLRAALAHTRAGDFARAHPRFESAIELGLSPDDEATATIGLTSIIHELHGPRHSAEVLAAAADRLTHEPTARMRVVLWRVNTLLFDDLRGAHVAAQHALAEAVAAGDPATIVHAEIVDAMARFFTGRPVDLTALTARVETTLASSTASNGVRANHYTSMLVWADDVDAAIEQEQAEIDRARAAGHVLAEAGAQQSITDAYFRCGRWDDGRAASERWEELTALAGSEPASEGSYTDLAWLLAMRGRFDEARQRAETAVERTKDTPMWHMQALAYAGVVAATAGAHAAAWDRLAAALAVADEIGFDDLCSLQFRDTCVEVLLALRRTDDAAAEAERITELAERGQRPRGLMQAARSRGLVAAANGDLAAASDAVAEALAQLEHLHDPFERARVLQLGGTVARRAGRRTESREQLDEARRLFGSLGAVPFVERTDAELQRLGSRTGRTDLLTHGEQQVAELVCDGRTNAEVAAALFITPRTVEAHLTRVYRKLGVRSRAELIARRSLLEV